MNWITKIKWLTQIVCAVFGHSWMYTADIEDGIGNRVTIWRECERCHGEQWYMPICKRWSYTEYVEISKEK